MLVHTYPDGSPAFPVCLYSATLQRLMFYLLHSTFEIIELFFLLNRVPTSIHNEIFPINPIINPSIHYPLGNIVLMRCATNLKYIGMATRP